MLSKPLFKATLKQNYIVFLIILAVSMMYLPIIISMYDPAAQGSLDEVLAMLPKELISAMGFSEAGSTLLGFIASYFYGFLILLLPMIYTIIIANRSIASLVDKGSMAYLLSTPNARMKIAGTQATYLLVSTTLLIGIITVVGIIVCNINFPGELDVKGFVILNAGALLLYYAITGIGFFASCFFNDTKNSLAVGAGLPVAFLLFQMISDVGEATDFLRYFSLFTLYNPEKITSGEGFGLSFFVMGIIGILSYAVALFTFQRRDLPL